MKIIHIESGLGNQMLSYCEYLAIKKMNPNDDCYIETIVFDIPECNDIICQWNGYELERVFKVKAHNVKELFDQVTWQRIIEEVRISKFWKKHWNWPIYITKALNNAGLKISNTYGDREENAHANLKTLRGCIRGLTANSDLIFALSRRYIDPLFATKRIQKFDKRKEVFVKTDESIITGQRLNFKYHNNDIHLIENDINRVFQFPAFDTEQNIRFADFLDSCNAVFIHARRGDMLTANGWCYKYGYFRRAVKHIKKHVDNPIFVFFTNTGSIEWCKDNAKTFGLDYSKDKVYFVDWNTGSESYRDMQLMGHCKHAIITNSTFGWWGSYFIKYKDKITISPLLEINTTYHC